MRGTFCRMKMKNAIGVAVLMALVASSAYWIGYQHGSGPSRVARITSSRLRQVGLSFRHTRNDLAGPFSVIGPVAAPTIQAQAQER